MTEPQGLDLDRPSVARVYDWLLGGSANWAIDREFGAKVVATVPLLKSAALANRLFLHRVVRHLVGLGVRQFVDIGSGIPTMGNTHEVAEEAAPDSKVVYVDYEPVAVAHSRILLERHGDPARHAVVQADMRDPRELWESVAGTGVIDFSQPIALLLIAVLHMQQLDRNGVEAGPDVVAHYRKLLPSGSYLALSHITDEGVPSVMAEQLVDLRKLYEASSGPMIWRSHQEIRGMLGDFEVIEPGMTWTPLWHPEEARQDSPELEFDTPAESVVWAGVGRKH